MWDKITNFLNFTGVQDKTVWQDIFITVLLIPLVIFFYQKFINWWNRVRPSRLIFKKCLDKSSNIYIFHSQMSSADDNWNLKENPKYITRFPQPIPTNHTNLGIQKKFNIDPVSSGADSECVADIFNILGQVQKTKNIYIGDLINDWNMWSSPMFSVGFNPKTYKLMERADPILFELTDNTLKIKDTNIGFGCVMPNDAGVIQKTFDKESKTPVFILAGLGTIGTSAAGSILKNNFVKFGKLFGNNSFCIFFSAKIDEGKSSALIRKIVPQPKYSQIIMHPILYFTFKNKGYFDIIKI
ncbi:MAG: hypothetical protein V1484_00550 [bacterium]